MQIIALSLKQKLALWTAVSVSWMLLLAIVGYAFYDRIDQANQKKDVLLKETIIRQTDLQELVKSAQDMRIAEKQYVASYDNRSRQNLAQQKEKIDRLVSSDKELHSAQSTLSTYTSNLQALDRAHGSRMTAIEQLHLPLQHVLGSTNSIIRELQGIQSERQMEGRDLGEIERELMNSGQQAVILALQIENALQRYLLSGDLSSQKKLESLIAGDDSLVLDALVAFSNQINIGEIMENAAGIPNAMSEFRTGVRNVSSRFAEEQAAREQLDAAGNKVLDEIQNRAQKLGQTVNTQVRLAETSANKVRNQGVFWLIIILILGVVLFIIAANITRNAILQPVNAAAQLAILIRQGVLSGRISNSPPGELGRLCTALNEMAEGLESKAELAEAIADGDLSVQTEIASDDDVLGLALRDMTASLNNMMGRVRTVANEVGIGADRINAASRELSLGASSQSSSLREITSSLREMSGKTQHNAEHANEADKLASSAREVAQTGNNKMADLAIAMRDIEDASVRISKIIKVIDDIAFQTNLLALNAAVEAARAGQHGRGFGVVAQEIRQLAVRSADAARETADLVHAANREIRTGVSLANETDGYLEEIVTRAIRVSDLVTQIASGSTNQAAGIAQINQNLTLVDAVTQENTVRAQETTRSATQLAEQANRLQELLDQFQLADDLTDDTDEPSTRF